MSTELAVAEAADAAKTEADLFELSKRIGQLKLGAPPQDRTGMSRVLNPACLPVASAAQREKWCA
jgi:hypothetical protein